MNALDSDAIKYEFAKLCNKSSKIPEVCESINSEWNRKNRYSNNQPCK